MVGRGVVVECEHTLSQWMPLAHDTDVARVKQARMAKVAVLALSDDAGDEAGEKSHRQVGLATFHQTARVACGQRQHAQVHQRLRLFDPYQQRRRQQRGGGIGHGQAHLHGIVPGVKVSRRQRLAQRGKGRTNLRPHRLRMRGGPHAVGHPHEQVLAHGFTQPAQRVTDGRLRHRQTRRSTGQAAFGHDSVKDAQQVQVERAEVHGHGK